MSFSFSSILTYLETLGLTCPIFMLPLYPKDEKLTDEVVEALYIALKNRRLVAYGGEMKKLHKAVKDKDDKIRTDVTGLITTYHWKVGGYYCSNKL